MELFWCGFVLVFVVVMIPDSLFMQKLLDIINLNLQKRLAFLYLQLGPANFLLAACSKRNGHKGYRQKNKNAHMTMVRQTDTSSDAKSKLKQLYLPSCSQAVSTVTVLRSSSEQ